MRISDWSSDVCSSDLEVQAHRATIAKLAVDDIAGAGPAFRFLEQRMIDDDPELVIGKVDRLVVFIPTLPRIGADQDDPANLARLGCLHSIGIEAAAQYARDALDLLLLAADQMPDARNHDFARVDVVRFRFRSEEHTSELQSLMRISYA